MKNLIKLKNISKIYANGVRALNNISLEISDGEMVYLTGRSGSGKSTLLKLLYNGEKTSKGSLHVNQWHVSKMTKRNTYKLRRDIGIVFQDFKLLPNLTVYENVAYVLEAINEDLDVIEASVTEALVMVGLEEKRHAYPAECSGGEQQRVAIARAICKNPSILLADEPTGNLDPKIAEDIMRLFYRINKQGTTVIMATHNWQLIERFPYRVIEIDDGRVLRDRSKNHISILVSEDFNNPL